MMELVDMLDSKSGVRKDVGVQVPLWVDILRSDAIQIFLFLVKFVIINWFYAKITYIQFDGYMFIPLLYNNC